MVYFGRVVFLIAPVLFFRLSENILIVVRSFFELKGMNDI